MGAYLSQAVTDKESSDGENDHVKYGTSAMQGWRVGMEDAHSAIADLDKSTSFFGVFDGHGGKEVAKFCSRHLHQEVLKSEAYARGELGQSLISAFLRMDELMTEEGGRKELAVLAAGGESGYGESLLPERIEGNQPLILAMESDGQLSIRRRVTGRRARGSEMEGPSRMVDVTSDFVSASAYTNSSSVESSLKASSDEKRIESNASFSPGEEMGSGSSAVDNGGEIIMVESKGGGREGGAEGGGGDVRGGEEQEVTGPLTDPNEVQEGNGDGKILRRNCDLGKNAVSEEEPLMKGVVEVMDGDDDDDDDDEEYVDEGEDDDDDGEEEEEEEDVHVMIDPEDLLERASEESKFQGPAAGCTAVVALLREDTLIVANAGDSRCVISRNGQACDLSMDHKPDLRAERERILNAGGFIKDGRINASLNLSRAIGDMEFKQNRSLPPSEQIVTAYPDVRTAKLVKGDEFMILACDGVWDVMSSQRAVDFVRARLRLNKPVSSIIEELFDTCLAPDTSKNGLGCDNMTAVIVVFKNLISEHAYQGETRAGVFPSFGRLQWREWVHWSQLLNWR